MFSTTYELIYLLLDGKVSQSNDVRSHLSKETVEAAATLRHSLKVF